MTKTGQVIGDRLWQIGFAIAVAACGYLIGQIQTDAKTQARMEAIEDDQKIILSRLRGRFGFMNDATARVNYLCQDDRECREAFEPLRVPE